ncbi:hypothetical protein A0H81_05248 [Grifola frondosa]|uniref:Uncharacterized protein n=1 Tax=Grifola frondosa TaxID=5627 RepID=A0A1C7MDA0_GRIFR|nr:hypothetical protein A0H81_05248 [Grifola frondosa]
MNREFREARMYIGECHCVQYKIQSNPIFRRLTATSYIKHVKRLRLGHRIEFVTCRRGCLSTLPRIRRR